MANEAQKEKLEDEGHIIIQRGLPQNDSIDDLTEFILQQPVKY